MRDYRRLWIGIGILILLSPLGLILPELFSAGGAWGEWGIEEIAEWMHKEGLPAFIPDGLKRLSELWKAPFPDYTFKGWEEGIKAYVSYIITAAIGGGAVVALTYILFNRKGKQKGVKNGRA